MALQYRTFTMGDFGNGIDQHSPENRIREGFLETALNADTHSSGYLLKRTGYQRHLGDIPLPIKFYEETAGGKICFTLEEGIDVTSLKSTPIVVKGEVGSKLSGDFNISGTLSPIYYSGFTTDVKKTFLTGSNSISLLNNETNLDTPYAFIGTTGSDSLFNNSNTIFEVNSISIDKSTYETTVDYVNSSGSSFEGFIYYREMPTVSGTTYVHTYSSSLSPGTTLISIPQSTHNLNSNFIVNRVYLDDGSTLTAIKPDSFIIDESTGDITLEIVNGGAGAITDDVIIILTVVPSTSRVTSDLPSGGSKTITVFGFEGTYIFPSIYLQDVGAGTLEEVEFDSISVDVDAQEINFTFVNNSGSPTNFEIYWVEGRVSSNRICVDANSPIGAFAKTSDVELTLWGLSHEEIYDGTGSREGWVNHIDTYRSLGESDLICGLGGLLYKEGLYGEGTNSADYLLSLAYPNLRARVDTTAIVGPLFTSDSSPSRTRGAIVGSNLTDGFAEITEIAYSGTEGQVNYALTITSVDDSFYTSGVTISTAAGLEDYLTAEQTGHSFLNGEFKILAVDDSQLASGTLVLTVENPSITTSDFDEVDVGGLGAVFTDQVELSDDSPFLPGDKVVGGGIVSSSALVSVKSPSSASNPTTLVIGSILEETEIPAGLRLIGERANASVIPLRTLTGTKTVENFVAGDLLTYSQFDRKLRIKKINVLDDVSITIDGDGETATVTMGSEDTSTFSVGQKLLLSVADDYSSEVIITAITGIDTFQFSSTSTKTGISGRITGKTVEIDEQITLIDSVDNSITYGNHGRWIRIDTPFYGQADLVNFLDYRYFDSFGYQEQPFLRSVMVKDNLYLTNGEDEVFKYDGQNIYKAGLPRWQPQLFLTTNTTTGSVIDVGNTGSADVVTTSVANGSMRITVDTGGGDTAGAFSAGDLVVLSNASNDEQKLTVASVDTTNQYIYFTSKVTITSPNLVRIRNVYKYYFRLNAIDVNGNVTASAVTGSSDYEVELTENAAVQIRLVGMPAFKHYDYQRIDIEIYRTRAGQVAPFYRVDIKELNFNDRQGYLDFTDANSDDDLVQLDVVNTALLGEELGTRWSEPLRAKYVTSDGNRLILGNVKSYPKLDVRLFKDIQTIDVALKEKAVVFKKDSTDALSTINMTDRAAYEFTNANKRTITNLAYSSSEIDVGISGTAPAHVEVGSWVYLYHSSKKANASNLAIGWGQVSANSGSLFTVSIDPQVGLGVYSSAIHADTVLFSTSANPRAVPILADDDFNFQNGEDSTWNEFTLTKRLAAAINTSMRMTSPTLSTTDFTPWLTASAGGEFEVGQIIINQPLVLSATSSVTWPAGNYRLFINGTVETKGSAVETATTVYPSRVIGSYPNYPEIFDSPESILDSESPSAISVNSSDGQQLTGLIPFFGSSAFGAAQKSSVVVALKENSLYLLDYNQKAIGGQSLQKLETRGQGCRYPYSVAYTRFGIMFANSSGIYRLNRNMQVEYIGEFVERIWNREVETDYDVSLFHGTHFALENKYKLSLPLKGQTVASDVLVYDHTRESQQSSIGSWTRYDSHPAIGWANFDENGFFASTKGRVYGLRKAADDSDFRDDDEAIAMDAVFRMWDLGDSALRKAFRNVRLHFRAVADSSGTVLSTALDSSNTFEDASPFLIDGNESTDGLSDVNSERISSIKFRIDRRKGTYLQLRLKNSSKDEPVELTHADITAAPLGYRGTKEAADTTG